MAKNSQIFFVTLMPRGATRQNVNELISLTLSSDTDTVPFKDPVGSEEPAVLILAPSISLVRRDITTAVASISSASLFPLR